MRLLHSKKPGLPFEDFYSEALPEYLILSHTWYDASSEPTFQDVRDGEGNHKFGLQKILRFKELVAAMNVDYFWVDTCCIDKTSSAELTEAINSMFLWYKRATNCI